LPKSTDLLREPLFARVYRSRMDPRDKTCREPVSTWAHLILWGARAAATIRRASEISDNRIKAPILSDVSRL
jgi:hypothetical protein